MADSNTYKQKVKDKDREIDRYNEDIKDLQAVLDNLTNDLNYEICEVNNALYDLEDELRKAVRYNTTFTAAIEDVLEEKEKGVGSDADLSKVKSNLEDEIATLKQKKGQAEADKNYYDRKYEEAKKAEKDK